MVQQGASTSQERWLEGSPNERWLTPRLEVSRDDLWQVMKVDEHLVDLSTTEGIEPKIEERRRADGQHALGYVVREGSQPAPDSCRQQKRFH